MVDVRSLEGHHIGNQAMLAVQFPVVIQADRRLAVPAEGMQRFGDEFPAVGVVQAALRLEAASQFQSPSRKDLARGQNAGGLVAQRDVVDQEASCVARNAVECTGTPAGGSS
ncbi:hypothetical protein G6F35_017219 [Rhizopus arrhizus]|nr:hypothetical protein G6F35_017219 [Rhizopus arrhizus]